MIRAKLCVALFLLFAISISIPSSASAEYLEEIKDDPVQSLFSEAFLQSHLNEKVSFELSYNFENATEKNTIFWSFIKSKLQFFKWF